MDCYKQVKDRVESTNDNVEAKLTHLASKQDSSNRSRSFTQGGQGGLNCEVAPLIPLKIPQSPDDASRVAHKCATIDCMDFANAKYQKTMLDSSKAKSPKEIPHINFLDYCLFITFFPQLIAGPIVHHKEMMPQFYKMSRRDSVLGGQCDSVADFLKGTNAKFANLCENPQSSHSPTALVRSTSPYLQIPRILEEEKQAQNLHKQPNNSRIFTQEVQNVAKSQAEEILGVSQNLHNRPRRF